jgi:GntR family transcriptional regulator
MSTRLDPHVPFYYQVKQELLEQLAEGRWPPGTRFPTELELTRRYGVSRPTIRQALTELVQEGYLTRHRGRGTFVAPPAIVDNAQVFTTLDELGDREAATETRLVRCEEAKAPALVARDLSLEPGETVYAVTSQRLLSGQCVALRTSWVPTRLAPGLDARIRAADVGSDVYAVLQDAYALLAVGAEQTFRATAASQADAAELHLRRGGPVLVWEGVIFAAHGVRMARVRTVFRGDRFAFAIRQGQAWPQHEVPERTVGVGILDTIDGRIW